MNMDETFNSLSQVQNEEESRLDAVAGMQIDSDIEDMTDGMTDGNSGDPLCDTGSEGLASGTMCRKRNIDDTEEDTVHGRKREPVNLDLIKSVQCCQMFCLNGMVRILGILYLSAVRRHFQSLSRVQRYQYVLDMLLLTCNSMKIYNFVLGGQSLCANAWCCILGLPISTYNYIRRKFEGGQRSAQHFREKGKLQEKSYKAIVWLEGFAKLFSDKMPDTDRWHLPSCLTRGGVYQAYIEYCKDIGEQENVSKEHFLKLWREHLPKVTIPPISRFSKCDRCTILKEKLQGTNDKETRGKLVQLRDCHLQKQNEQRKKYYKHITKAKQHPNKYLSIIIDGMDQNKTFLPHFLHKTKTTSPMLKLKMHLTGVLVHGIASYGFFDFGQWRGGSNSTITCLLLTFNSLRDRLPPTLYVQMDNSWKDNKNRYVLAFFGLLVELGIFKKVKIQFLMVGHTHEDIDQLFSRLSIWLNRTPVYTVDDMITVFNKCYHHHGISAQGAILQYLLNFSSWLEPYITKMTNQSKPHAFKIKKGENGKATMHWKHWSTDKTWEDCLAENGETLLMNTPKGHANKCIPCYDDLDLTKLKLDIKKSMAMFEKSKEAEWWEHFFEEIENEECNFDEEQAVDLLSPLVDAARKKTANSTTTDFSSLGIPDDAVPLEPVIFGRKRMAKKTKEKNLPTAAQDMPQPGDMAAVNLDKYAGEWPQVCKVIKLNGEDAEVGWYKGAMTMPYVKWTCPVYGQRGKREQRTESIPLSCFVCWGFKMTPSNKLPEEAKRACNNYKKSFAI